MRQTVAGSSQEAYRQSGRQTPGHRDKRREQEITAARHGRPDALSPAAVLALQRSAGNAAVQQALARRHQPLATVQRGKRWNAVKKKITKERGRKTWKKGRKWPEQGLKGRLLERMDKYSFRTGGRGYIDMNKIKANFPAIDGIANGKFRQVKAYLAIGDDRKLTRRNAVQRIVAQAIELEDKSEKAVRDLVKDNGRLLKVLLDINRGRRSTAGSSGKAPYEEGKKTKKARARHKGVLPLDFRTEAKRQLTEAEADPNYDYDQDALGMSIMKNMVVVVPDELAAEVKKELKAAKVVMEVEGIPGITSTKVKTWMDRVGYTPSARGEDDDTDYVG